MRKTDPIRFYNRPSDFHENFTLELRKIYNITNDMIHRGATIRLPHDTIRIAILTLYDTHRDTYDVNYFANKRFHLISNTA